MKKLFYLSSLILAIMFTFMAVSCTQATPYSFSAYWQKNKVYTTSFSEEVTYNVNYLSEFKYSNKTVSYNFSKEDNNKADFSYSNGKYKTSITALSSLPEETKVTDEGAYFKLSTTFSIDVSYTIKNKENTQYNFTDSINSVVYFKSAQESLSPIYSKKFYDTTSLNGANITRYSYETTIIWNKKAELSIVDKTSEIKDNLETSDNYSIKKVNDKNYSVKYTAKATLDNEQLLFALRGFTFNDKFNSNVKIYDTAYPSNIESINIAYRDTANITTPWDLIINNSEAIKNDKTSTYFVSVGRSNSTYSGSPKLCYYQVVNYSGENTEIENNSNSRAFLTKIIDKLPNQMGALEYVMKTATITD